MDNFNVVGAQGVQQAGENNSLPSGCGQSGLIEAKAEISTLPAPRRRRETGYVYFITDGEFIKIGFSVCVEFRRDDLQGANPRPLTIIDSFVGSRSDEGDLHRKFQHLRVSGEWFRPDPEITSFIELVRIMRAHLGPQRASMTRILNGSAEDDLLREHAEARAEGTYKVMATWFQAARKAQTDEERKLHRFCELGLEMIRENLKHQGATAAVALAFKYAAKDFAQLNELLATPL